MAVEVVVFVPAGDHPATDGLRRGSAIVGQPEPGAENIRIHFEGAVFGQSNLRTLADRAVHAHGRLSVDYPTVAARMVPRDTLVAVGTFNPASGRIILAGTRSARALTAWLDSALLDPAELVPTQRDSRLHRGRRQPEV